MEAKEAVLQSPSIITILSALLWAALLSGVGSGALAVEKGVPLVRLGPTQWTFPAESAKQAAARHALVAKRRSRTAVVLHRGGLYLAPENTLAAFNTALDVGADGWEIDIHRTRDGVLVVFHDHDIQSMLDGAGLVEDIYYEELILYTFRAEPAGKSRRFWVPTLAEVLALARQRSALLILDTKTSDISRSVADMIEAGDLWDHVVDLGSRFDLGVVRGNPRYRPPPNSSWLTSTSHEVTSAEDADLRTLRAELAQKPQFIVSDDARIVLEVLGRSFRKVSEEPRPHAPRAVEKPQIAQLLSGLFGLMPWLDGRLAGARLINFHGEVVGTEVAKRFRPGLPHSVRLNVAWTLGMAARYYRDKVTPEARDVLVTLARDPEADVRTEAAHALGFCARPEDLPALITLALEGHEDARHLSRDLAEMAISAAHLRVRAAAAEALGRLGDPRPSVIEALTALVRMPAPGGAWPGDSPAAARALALLGARQTLDALRDLLRRDGRDFLAANPWLAEQGADPSWADSESRTEAAAALATIGGVEDMAFLSSLFATWPEGKDKKEQERIAMRLTWELMPAVEALARREDAAAREACAKALFSPLGEVRREAFFRLWGAENPGLTAEAVAQAVTHRLDQAKDLAGCAMALHLLGYLGVRGPEVDAALAKGKAATNQAIRERAAWAYARLRG